MFLFFPGLYCHVYRLGTVVGYIDWCVSALQVAHFLVGAVSACAVFALIVVLRR